MRSGAGVHVRVPELCGEPPRSVRHGWQVVRCHYDYATIATQNEVHGAVRRGAGGNEPPPLQGPARRAARSLAPAGLFFRNNCGQGRPATSHGTSLRECRKGLTRDSLLGMMKRDGHSHDNLAAGSVHASSRSE